MTNAQGLVTASVLLEYLFCPRFIYFMNCLMIKQNEDRRFKVLKGREAHAERAALNVDYLRKRIGCVEKRIDVQMASEKFGIKGVVDEALTLDDGTMAPLDYKYSEFRGTVYRTHRYQSVFYGLLIRETFGREVRKGFVCYTRSASHIEEIPISDGDFAELQRMIAEIVDITRRCWYPKGAEYKAQCTDCCYRNICEG